MVSIDRALGSLSDQVYQQIRSFILSGQLEQGDRLLPSRVLSEELGVSRNTVTLAYDRLVAEGFVASRTGAGHFVAAVGPERGADEEQSKKPNLNVSSLSARASQIPPAYLRRHRRSDSQYEFLYGEPSFDDFPRQAWARTLGKVARGLTLAQLSYPDYQGEVELRRAVAGYLGRARGIACSKDNVLIVHGTQEAIDLTCRLMIDPGDAVMLEQPFYRGFLKASQAAGATIRFVDVDERGLKTDRLPDAKLAFVTPSHQFPVGGVLPIGRRIELLEWASTHNAIVFEDDYDGEFRYSGPPVDSLKSLDRSGSVIYVGTVSKTFFPALQLGWMVVSDDIMARLLQLRAIADTTPPSMEQLAFAAFIDSGQFERHIFRVRKRYAQKRSRLLATLEQKLGNKVQIRGTDAGIHVLMRIPGLAPDQTEVLVARCSDRGVRVHSADIYYCNTPAFAELVIGYNAVPIDDIETGAGIIADEVLFMLTKKGKE